MKLDIPWNRYIVEGTLIVGSILLAFAIQAWWDTRQEEQVIEAYLEVLSIELDQVELTYQNHITYLEEQDQLVQEILDLASSPEFDSLSRLDLMLWNLGPFSPLRPSLAALNDLESIGLGRIGSMELRRALVDFRNTLSIDSEEQESFSEYWRNNISPYWDELFNIRDWIELGSSLDPDSIAGVNAVLPSKLPELSIEVPHEQILGDKLFLNQLSRRLIRSWRIRGFHQTVVEKSASLKQLIANEI